MEKKREILMIGDTSPGGMASVINQLIENGLSDEVVFLSSYKGGSISQNITYFSDFLLKYTRILLTKPDLKVIHIHTSHWGSFLRKAIITYIAKILKKKTIFHIHGSDFNNFYDKSPNIIKFFITDILNKSDLILTLSSQWQKDIAQKCSNSNIKILYNPSKLHGINLRKSETVNVLFLGRLGQRKGVYDIIEAAKYLSNPNIRINLYGDGKIDEFRDLVIKNNLDKIINIGGWISGNDIDKVFTEADICILPSYKEGLPMFILEAMGYGLPVISTPVGGIPDSIEDGINGYLIKPGDYIALAEKIEILAGNPELRHKMGQESYKLAGEKFEISVVVTKLREIHKELIDQYKQELRS